MDFDDIKDSIPHQSPVQPHQLTLDSEFQFSCHPGVACFNACCKNIQIQLTPYDIIRLKKHLDLSSQEFVARYTVPFEMDHHGMPGLHLSTKPGTRECVFLTEQGCGIYQDRPAACRYYALGSMGMRAKDSPEVQDVYFVVKESHCLGHDEPKTQTVRDYRREQGIETYDEMNREWRDVILKKRSSGPTVGTPSQRSMQLFDMCSYDMDSFRDFIQSQSFREMFDISDTDIETLKADDEELLRFSMRFLKQVLYGEMSIPLKEGARQSRVEQRKDIWDQRRADDIKRWRAAQEAQQYEEDKN